MIGKEILQLKGHKVRSITPICSDGYYKGFTIEGSNGVVIEVSPYAINEHVAMLRIECDGSQRHHSKP